MLGFPFQPDVIRTTVIHYTLAFIPNIAAKNIAKITYCATNVNTLINNTLKRQISRNKVHKNSDILHYSHCLVVSTTKL